jgi:hypothetical protein
VKITDMMLDANGAEVKDAKDAALIMRYEHSDEGVLEGIRYLVPAKAKSDE